MFMSAMRENSLKSEALLRKKENMLELSYRDLTLLTGTKIKQTSLKN